METSIYDMVKNKSNLYDGDLTYYFKVVFNSPNTTNGFHNFRHMIHVFSRCYEALEYYRRSLNSKTGRALLIAALFHDYDHSGHSVNDQYEVDTAIERMKRVLLPKDAPLCGTIEIIMRATQYPHIEKADLSLPEQIIRDADMTQSFSDIWLQEVIFGLAKESNRPPLDILKLQLDFLPKITFYTQWARKKYARPRTRKLKEVRELLQLLD